MLIYWLFSCKIFLFADAVSQCFFISNNVSFQDLKSLKPGLDQ